MDWLQILSNTASSLISPATLGYALAALGLAMHFGYTGLINMGIAGFMAIGAYGFAISTISFAFPWWLAALTGLIASGIFALILGIPTLRLRGDYLAIVTIAAAEVVRLLFLTTAFDDVTGSADGLSGYQKSFQEWNPLNPSQMYGFGPWEYNGTAWWVRIIGIITVAVAALILWLLVRSPWGRTLRGIREDEDAVRSLGKNVYAFKLQSLVIGGMFAAAGGIVISLERAVSPGVYVTSLTFFIWTALLLGGAATVFGPIVGSLIFWALQTFLSNVLPAMVKAGFLPFMTEIQASTVRYILVGIALMLLVIFMPQGILGNKKELTFVK